MVTPGAGCAVLWTSEGKRLPSNPRKVASVCASVTSKATVSPEWEWTLGRYELPLAVMMDFGEYVLFVPVATRETLANDPR